MNRPGVGVGSRVSGREGGEAGGVAEAGSHRASDSSCTAHRLSPPPISGSVADPGDGSAQHLAAGGPGGIPQLRPALPRGPGLGSQAHQHYHRRRGKGERTLPAPTRSQWSAGRALAGDTGLVAPPVRRGSTPPADRAAVFGEACGSKSCPERPTDRSWKKSKEVGNVKKSRTFCIKIHFLLSSKDRTI